MFAKFLKPQYSRHKNFLNISHLQALNCSNLCCNKMWLNWKDVITIMNKIRKHKVRYLVKIPASNYHRSLLFGDKLTFGKDNIAQRLIIIFLFYITVFYWLHYYHFGKCIIYYVSGYLYLDETEKDINYSYYIHLVKSTYSSFLRERRSIVVSSLLAEW